MKQLVLIVEDNVNLRTKLKQLMELEGFDVAVKKDGVEAIDFLEKTIPDVIVSDVEMPRMNGHELLKYKLKNPDIMHVPFILCSGVTENLNSNSALNFGADCYLRKPFRFIDLIRAVKSLIEKNNNRTYKEIQDWVLRKYYLQ